MKYVIGIDLGTSAVKLMIVDQMGSVLQETLKSYPLIQEKSGYSEQDPELWVEQTINGLNDLLENFSGNLEHIEGISFSGQMHGLVLLDENNHVLRNAILWNDTRTSEQCEEIYNTVGKDRLLQITKNLALEGFTLPKILWVKKYEREIYEKISTFLLPKDYLRFRLTGKLHTEYSDAAGTLLLDIGKKQWSKEICNLLEIDESICPPLVRSVEYVGFITEEIAEKTGLSITTKVFAGGADNACGAIGSGILEEGKTLCSVGTSGVVLSYESSGNKDFAGKVHYFNHGATDAFYTMGVTLAAGYSLSWLKDTFFAEETYENMLADIDTVPIGSNGLLYTPYLVGERTPHADSTIRASFIGVDSSHERKHFVRAVMEGITFSLYESIDILRASGKEINQIISIGGGAKNDVWLQMQANVFNAKVIKLQSEQGPGLGAAMIAAHGCDWFKTLKQCGDVFLQEDKSFVPIDEDVQKYSKLFSIYKTIYHQTKQLNKQLLPYRN